MIYSAVTSFLKEHLSTHDDSWVVALSGGLDSCCLLHVLHQYSEKNPHISLSVVHINHGLSAHADEWQYFCECLCAQYNLPIFTQTLSLKKQTQTSLEALAREQRYEAIESLCQSRIHSQKSSAKPSFSVLLGQHLDDQLETFLLQLKRGAGPRGLGAMGTIKHSSKSLRYVRPLLTFSREALYEYAIANNLKWCEDESNNDRSFDRNFLRHDIIPLLKARWPSIAETVSRSAELCAQTEQIATIHVSKLYGDAVDKYNRLSIDIINSTEALLRAHIIRYWINDSAASMPSYAVLNQILSSLSAQQDKHPCVQWQDWQCRRYGKYLYLHKQTFFEELYENERINLAAYTPYKHKQSGIILSLEESDNDLAGLSQLPFCTPKQPLTISFNDLSSRCALYKNRPSKALKDWFKEWGIPPWLRQRVPVIKSGEEIVAVYHGGKVFENGNVVDKTEKIFLITSHSLPY